jgi:hypothetical protein
VLPADSPLRWWDGFPVAFALTCVIELPTYLLALGSLGWLGRRGDPERPLSRLAALALGFAVNLITHPVLWAVSHQLRTTNSLLLAEVGVVVVEGLLIFLVAVRLGLEDRPSTLVAWALLAAVGANALSLAVGLAVMPWLLGT